MRVIFDITLLIIVLSPHPTIEISDNQGLLQQKNFILQLFVKVNKCTLVEFWLAAGGWFSRNPKTILLNPTSPPEKIFWPPTIMIFWKLLVRAFRKHLTSRGPWAHCSGPETPTQWKAVSGSDGRRDLSISKGCVQLTPPMHYWLRWSIRFWNEMKWNKEFLRFSPIFTEGI